MPSLERVLIVDDEPLICRVCARLLTAEGFAVDMAANGLAAQKMLKQKDYDYFVLDIKMPGMNGIEFYDFLCRTRRSSMRDKVLFITGDAVSNDVEKFLKDGDVSYLTKPFTPDDFKAAVNRMACRP